MTYIVDQLIEMIRNMNGNFRWKILSGEFGGDFRERLQLSIFFSEIQAD